MSKAPISEKQVTSMEHYIDKQAPEPDFEVDDAMKEHLESLGLWNEAPTDGSQYISENYRGNEKEN